MRKSAVVCCAAAALGAAALAVPGDGARQVAYFKSATRNRVFVLVGDLSPEEARAALDRQAWTEGRFTAAVLYPEGFADPGRVTLAPSFADANMRAALPGGYLCRLVVAPTGKRAFDGACA